MRTLREWRAVRMLTVRDLSERTGLSTKTIVDIELERQTPRFDTIRRVCEELGVSPDEVQEFSRAIEERGKDAA